MKPAASALLVLLALATAALAADPPPITDDVRAALDHISADSLRGHLSFIASDLLEGRDTPSRGLDIAAEYIAAQFRRAGLEPAGDEAYFQTAPWTVKQNTEEGFTLRFRIEHGVVNVPVSRVSRPRGGAIDL